MKNPLIIGSVFLGLIFCGLAVVYFVTQANQLPSFLPGYDPTLVSKHYKHGVGAIFLGLGCFALAWFQSGKKSAEK